jgi:hypothetical protein
MIGFNINTDDYWNVMKSINKNTIIADRNEILGKTSQTNPGRDALF